MKTAVRPWQCDYPGLIEEAVRLLRQGEPVALPTETVYGLAADALNPEAVAKVFETKERPRFDPLIVHLPKRDWLEKVTRIEAADRALVEQLVNRFWPGPFTIVLPKRSIVPDIVTAGLETVAVRMSAHPAFASICAAFAQPLAAPSANRFGHISPTTAQHVREELDGRIPLIVDSGPTTHGVESTIVSVRGNQIEILRSGPVTQEELEEFGVVHLRGIGFQPMSVSVDPRGIGFQPMNPFADISIREGSYLPHWTQAGATYAVTFRLSDALPAKVLAEWEFERKDILQNARQQNRELTEAERQRLDKLYSEKVERYLDAGHGKCWLRDERIAQAVGDALLHFDGERYELVAWCVMPNHVHAVVRPKEGHLLPEILHSWKSYTAKKANQLFDLKGAFWQRESYDHLIRDEADFRNQVRYVVENPAKAGLESWPWVGTSRDHRLEANATQITAPGQLPSHYAPRTRLRLIDSAQSFVLPKDQRVGLLAWNRGQPAGRYAAIRQLTESGDLREAATNLFGMLRELDALNLDLIVAERVPETGLGVAINDRLGRAAR